MSEQRRSVPLGRIGLTLLAGALGGALFSVFSLPAAWMSGSLVGVALLVVFRIDPVMPKALRDLGFLLAGAVTGSSITPEMLQAVARYPLSLVILAVTTLAIIYLGQWVLMRFFRWDAHSALFGAMPGALSAVIASVDDAGGDMMRVITVQTFRIFVLISVLPGAALLSAPVMGISAGQTLPAGSFAVMMIFGTIAALLFHRWRVMAPYLFGGMAAAAALHLGGNFLPRDAAGGNRGGVALFRADLRDRAVVVHARVYALSRNFRDRGCRRAFCRLADRHSTAHGACCLCARRARSDDHAGHRDGARSALHHLAPCRPVRAGVAGGAGDGPRYHPERPRIKHFPITWMPVALKRPAIRRASFSQPQKFTLSAPLSWSISRASSGVAISSPSPSMIWRAART
jgi:membrane AbrB-like protein